MPAADSTTTIPPNHTHADAELVERARVYRYLLARSAACSSTLAALALEQAAEAIDEGAHHAQIETQPKPSGGWGDCWSELIEAAGEDHPLRAAMIERRTAGLTRYGQPLRRDDGRDADLDLREELLDAAVYAQRLGLCHLALELLGLAKDPTFNDEVFASIHSDEVWAEKQPVNPTTMVLTEVRVERIAQDAKWGEQDHQDHPGHDFWAGLVGALESAARAELAAGPTWAPILLEEVAEALQEDESTKLRAELVQVAAVAVAWIEALDRRARLPGAA